jgi:hypothetical protein
VPEGGDAVLHFSVRYWTEIMDGGTTDASVSSFDADAKLWYVVENVRDID